MKPLKVLVLVCVLLAGCSDDSSEPDSTTSTTATSNSSAVATTVPSTNTIAATYANGVVTTANARPAVKKGTPVALLVKSDKDEELHVHGYDKTLPLKANQEGRLEFTADITGVFEVELHHVDKLLLTLEVKP